MGHGGLRLANNYIDGRFPHKYPDRESYADSFCLTPVYGILARQLIRTSTKIRILDQHTQHIPEERILLVCLRSQKRKLDRLKPDRITPPIPTLVLPSELTLGKLERRSGHHHGEFEYGIHVQPMYKSSALIVWDNRCI